MQFSPLLLSATKAGIGHRVARDTLLVGVGSCELPLGCFKGGAEETLAAYVSPLQQSPNVTKMREC